EDPTGFGGLDANLSRYVGNAAVNFTDPSGRYGVPVIQDGTHLLDLTTDPSLQALMNFMNPTQATYAQLGYSNPVAGWIGETIVRNMLDDDRLAQQGGVGDDLLLTAMIVTEGTA